MEPFVWVRLPHLSVTWCLISQVLQCCVVCVCVVFLALLVTVSVQLCMKSRICVFTCGGHACLECAHLYIAWCVPGWSVAGCSLLLRNCSLHEVCAWDIFLFAPTLTKWLYSTRLETRTKESNACVSLRVANLCAT
jgi:hypothetical protein